MKNKLKSEEFVEILHKNNFNNTFNIPNNWRLDDIASSTIDFIKKDSEINTYPLNALSMVLKAYGISVETYFKFLETIKDIDFDDKEYKNFLTDGYINLFKEIDSSSIADLDKLKLKIKALELAEKSREKSEKNNMIGKVFIAATGAAAFTTTIVTVGVVAVKYMEYKEELEAIAANKSNVKEICSVIKEVGVVAIGAVAAMIESS